MATNTICTPWISTAAELASILTEMRPVIERFAARDRQLMADAAKAA